MFEFEREDTLNNEKANQLMKELKANRYEVSYIELSIEKYISSFEKNNLRKAIYELRSGKSPLTINTKDRLSFTGRTLKEYWIDYYQIVYLNNNFPYGVNESSFNRHKRIMTRRYEDVNSKVLKPPNFSSSKPYGLKEMSEYIDSKKRVNQPKPKVKGRTLILPMVPIHKAGIMNLSESITFTYINKFENVQVPTSYLIKFDYFDSTSNYKFTSIYDVVREIQRNGINGYKNATKFFESFEIICFNLFLSALRDKYLEIFIKFLLAFQLGHPDIYIKDVSGRGYNVYEKYSFYDELRSSRIDVSVL